MDLDRFYADMMQHVQRVLPLIQRIEPLLPQIEEMVRNHGAMQTRIQGIEHRVNMTHAGLPGVPQDANQAQAAMRAQATTAAEQNPDQNPSQDEEAARWEPQAAAAASSNADEKDAEDDADRDDSDAGSSDDPAADADKR